MAERARRRRREQAEIESQAAAVPALWYSYHVDGQPHGVAQFVSEQAAMITVSHWFPGRNVSVKLCKHQECV